MAGKIIDIILLIAAMVITLQGVIRHNHAETGTGLICVVLFLLVLAITRDVARKRESRKPVNSTEKTGKTKDD